MAQAPSKVDEDKKVKYRKEEKDNIFVDIIYNIVIQTPVLIISWIVSKFDWD